MKKMKNLMVFLLSLVMICSMTGCGSKGLPSDPAKLMKVANENMQKAKSMSAEGSICVDMTQGKEAVSATAKMDMDLIKVDDTFKAKMDLSIDMDELGGTQNMTMYMAPEGEKYYMYMNVLGQWTKMEYDMASVMDAQKKSEENADADDELGITKDNFTVTDGTDDDGTEVKIVEGTIPADKMKESFTKAMDTLKEKNVEGMDETQLKQLQLVVEGCMADVPMTYYVDKKSGQITYMSMDLAGIAEKAVEYISTMAGEDAKEMSGLAINQLSCDMKFSNYDKVEDFEIPEEALNAQDASAGLLNGAGAEEKTE